MLEPERIDRRRTALIAYDVCRRALVPSDPARRTAMRPVLDAWVQMIAAARAASIPVIYTTPVSRSDGADVVMLPTDLWARPACRHSPTLSRVPQRRAFLLRSCRALRITCSSSADRAPFMGQASQSPAHAAARHHHHRRRRHQSRRRDECSRGLQLRPRLCRSA
jgi:hypothetical protein